MALLPQAATASDNTTKAAVSYAAEVLAGQMAAELVRAMNTTLSIAYSANTTASGKEVVPMSDGQRAQMMALEKAAEAQRRITELTAEIEVGRVYEGTVLKILDFGAIIQVFPGKDGLLHISQIAHERVNQVSDYLKEGQVVSVKAIETDDRGRVKLSMKALLEKPAREPRDTAAVTPAVAAEEAAVAPSNEMKNEGFA